MYLCRQQFWLGPARVGQVVTFWVDCDMIHLTIDGTRIKTVRSHLTVTDLTRLAADGARPAGPPPLPTAAGQDGVIEIERAVSRAGTVALAGRVILAAEILAGRRVGIRIDGATLMFFDLQTSSWFTVAFVRGLRRSSTWFSSRVRTRSASLRADGPAGTVSTR
jgi:hypothetical protein